MSMQSDAQEAIYWAIESMTEGAALNALAYGLKPAEILDALNVGLERATRIHRAEEDKTNAGH